jgi:hypothetical protein
MYRPTLRRQAFRLGLLATLVATLVVLALNACGGGQEQADRPRPLPEDEKALSPGEYRSEEFKPSLTFRVVGKGWKNLPPEKSDYMYINLGDEPREMAREMGFANVQFVYKSNETGALSSSSKLVKAPDDLVGWLEHHPYLETSEPKPVTGGGGQGQAVRCAGGGTT